MANKKMTDNNTNSDSSTPEAKFFKPSVNLQKKVKRTNKNLDFVLADAAKGLTDMRAEYIGWAEIDIQRLEEAFTKLKASPNSKQAIMDVHWIAHDMKGQGGTFGYHLMTTVLGYLCSYLEESETMSSHGLNVTLMHIEATKTIISNRLTDSGGKIGEELLRGLREMIEKKA